ncbi:hypothetical protein PSU4_54800 [Pseudonocardia sulfidoxydans NBRC 16205]|uniref:Stress-response A/B barrel domain-containing protein n=1 Tax=Pseudonocardia sulfidoxydans NBRC 16205 TaxID=1223511 RepID=A0A511DNY1_9PSEU|nr:Dabb family protein [Pseudonocardia sulfidoxydans]GEL26526.1 hypothetical protein PSU4_54800 [Pseudonocardia sulfidoxydans NBRC 16205]
MLSHTVLFRLRRPFDDEQRAEFVAALRTFAAEAPLTAGPMTVTVNLGVRDPANARFADAALSATFTDAETFTSYLKHPRHQVLATEVLEPACASWLSLQAEVS